jgi:hypothetical protein
MGKLDTEIEAQLRMSDYTSAFGSGINERARPRQ